MLNRFAPAAAVLILGLGLASCTSSDDTTSQPELDTLSECTPVEGGNVELDKGCIVISQPGAPVTVESGDAVQVIELHSRKGGCRVESNAKVEEVKHKESVDTYIAMLPGETLQVEAVDGESCEMRIQYKLNTR